MTGSVDAARILVVDDDAFYRDLMQQELEDLGHACILAEDGAAALDIVDAQPVDLVLLDIMMPRIDGFGFLAAVHDRPELRDLPVIVISAQDDLASVARGIELGAVDYLSKPYEATLLKARIDACLERHRWRVQERAYLAEIERQRAIADDLLAAVLPREAIEELKGKGRVASRAHDRVAVMFLDVAGFSDRSNRVPPEVMVSNLTVLNERAEALAEDGGLEKIKLVGDAIMITGNLLTAHEDPVAACVDLAFRLFADARTIDNGWQMHGGIAYGPLVSGVIGRRRFAFDVWGATVNAAARLSTMPGRDVLHLDEAARNALTDRFATVSLGTNLLKGLDNVEIFRLDAPT
ncbi:MAG: adenylate/guanylate cyclase domain-containing protein [Pseudomonadota bacterium]